jgi:hypothetical protein
LLRLSRSGVTVAAVGAMVLAAIVISPAIGGPSLKRLVKKEVSKQLANKQGPQGPAGQQGAAGANFSADTSLRPGETLTGVWAVAGSTGENLIHTIQFTPQLPAALGTNAVHGPPPAPAVPECPGPGLAAAGHLCVYEVTSPSATFNFIKDPAVDLAGAGRRGALIYYTSSASTGNADGTWAVTAP